MLSGGILCASATYIVCERTQYTSHSHTIYVAEAHNIPSGSVAFSSLSKVQENTVKHLIFT